MSTMQTLPPPDASSALRHLPRFTVERLRVPLRLREDALVEAELAVWRASQAWRPDGGLALRDYCVGAARNAVREFLRQEDPLSRRQRERQRELAAKSEALPEWELPAVPLDLPCADGRRLADFVPAEDAGEALLLAVVVWQAIAALPERQARIMALLLVGHTQAEIGVRIGVSETRVSQLRAGAAATMRPRLEGVL